MRSRLRLQEGWSTYFLLLIIYLLVVWSLGGAAWAKGLGLLSWVIFPAVTLGLIFAKLRRLPGIIAHILATLLGIVWTFFVVSLLIEARIPMKERLLALAQRFLAWLQIAITEGASADDIMFVLQLGALLWLFGYLGSWFTFRRQQAWAAIIPAGVVLLVNTHYSPGGLVVFFVLYLFCALLLIVRVHVLAQQVHWQARRIAFTPDVSFDFLRDGAILSFLIILATLLLPNALSDPRWNDAWARFAEPWQRVQDEWARLYSSLTAKEQPKAVSFGRTLSLGGAVRLSDTPFFLVEAPQPRYWRAAAYDEYTSRGWVNTDNQAANWPANEYWPVPVYDMTEDITQTVRPIQSGGVEVYAAGQPIWADVPVRVDLSYMSMARGGVTQSGVGNVSVVRAERGFPKDKGYTVVSSVSIADERRLRQAGTQYPSWVLERYLQLPASLPDRVVNLAQEIVRGAENPYEAGMALESYLRREIKYSQNIEAPPSNADAVDHLLFESKTGYCDYYASAMVVMLRAVGIPARVASGYTGGVWDSMRRGYLVLYSDAHSWPEVFFPNYGWVPFEPTASEPLIARPIEEQTGLVNGGITPPIMNPFENEEKYGEVEVPAEGGAVTPIATPKFSAWAIVGLAAAGLLALALLALAVWWLITIRKMKPAERMFARMIGLSRLAGIRRDASETPREFAKRLSSTLGRCREDALFFADLYNRERFSAGRKVSVDGEAVREHWAALWKGVLTYRWRRLRAKFTIKPRPQYEQMPMARL